MSQRLRLLVALAALALPVAAQAEGCHLQRAFAVPLIGPATNTPRVAATINGKPAALIVDTGGAWSVLASALAQGLPTEKLPPGLRFFDAADTAIAGSAVKVESFALAGHPPSSMAFLRGEASTLGANVLRDYDAEIDPIEHKLNLFKHSTCDAPPVYWPHSDMAVVPFRPEDVYLISIEVKLDGKPVRALVDTGSEFSELDDRVARNDFDITPTSPGTEISRQTHSATGVAIEEYRHQFHTLEFGDLTITNPWLRVGVHGHGFFNAGLGPPMTIGMSTLAPFHLYIAYEQHRLYLTTAHGDLAAGRKPEAAETGEDPLDQVNQQELLESAENALRAGKPEAARRAFDQAVALAPNDPSPLAARAHFLAAQHDPAAQADYDRLGTLKLQTEEQYIDRSKGYRRAGQFDHALEDANAAVRLAPNSWVALNLRCWTQAVMKRIGPALTDCDAAHALAPKSSSIFDSRGFVHLQAGELDAALADYAAAIETNPLNASALYGRSLIERRRGDTAAADADRAAARAIRPDIDQNFGT